MGSLSCVPLSVYWNVFVKYFNSPFCITFWDLVLSLLVYFLQFPRIGGGEN